jgi:hypothetical protein
MSLAHKYRLWNVVLPCWQQFQISLPGLPVRAVRRVRKYLKFKAVGVRHEGASGLCRSDLIGTPFEEPAVLPSFLDRRVDVAGLVGDVKKAKGCRGWIFDQLDLPAGSIAEHGDASARRRGGAPAQQSQSTGTYKFVNQRLKSRYFDSDMVDPV